MIEWREVTRIEYNPEATRVEFATGVPGATGIDATAVTFVSHGSDPTVVRPSGHACVIWRGTVQPDNLLDNVDFWFDVS